MCCTSSKDETSISLTSWWSSLRRRSWAVGSRGMVDVNVLISVSSTRELENIVVGTFLLFRIMLKMVDVNSVTVVTKVVVIIFV